MIAETTTPVRLSPLERLEQLCDEDSLSAIRSEVLSRRMGEKAKPGDGIVAAAGRLDGRPIFCYAQDSSFAGGSLGEAHAETVVRVLRLAADARVPVVGCIESAGARMQEGVAALAGYARIFHEQVSLSGRVAQISVVTGTSAGGGSYAPALTDFVIMQESASMFLTGPAVVRDVMRESVTPADLGGYRVHRRNGVCHLTGKSNEDCVELVRELLSYLPQSPGELPLPRAPEEPIVTDPQSEVPIRARAYYDIRGVIERLVDGSRFLEIAPKWADNMVTAFARVDGRVVGIVANQPKKLGGTIDVDASQKAARFVRVCDAFHLPLVVLVDTPGFLPGTTQEAGGVIRHGADLLRAFAAASVPRMTVILRKAYGGAYITMNSKDLGAHLTFAWPSAEIGVMGAWQAVGILNRRELEAAEDADELRKRLAAQYARAHVSAQAAARDGFIDEVIEPGETRERITGALEVLGTRRRRREDRAGALAVDRWRA